MIGFALRLLRDRARVILGRRDPRFPARERDFLRRHPACVGCGRPATTAHHVIPFHVRPDLEMDEGNWAAVEKDCHYVIGHQRNWRKWNDRFWETVAELRAGARGPLRPPAED